MSSLKSDPSTAPVAPAQSYQDLLALVTQRRTNYALSPASPLSDAEIRHILEVTLTQAPSTFGSYTTRMVVALKDEHLALWDTISDVVQAVTPAAKWAAHTQPRLAGFRNAYGTVLFFEDPGNTAALQDKFPFIASAFPTFSEHTNAMHQYIVWTALTAAGLGANLQHYNPLVDEQVKARYNVPQEWKLVAQLVFGAPTQPSNPKPTAMAAPMEERLRMFGAAETTEKAVREVKPVVVPQVEREETKGWAKREEVRAY